MWHRQSTKRIPHLGRFEYQLKIPPKQLQLVPRIRETHVRLTYFAQARLPTMWHDWGGMQKVLQPRGPATRGMMHAACRCVHAR